jgi:hypothetical protein
MSRRHDKFALRAVEVAAPIWHDAIGANGVGVILVPALAAVAADDMVWDAGLLVLRSNGGSNT